jgi:hypothetical protein
MKKVLENELISLAHRILKMRGKANVEQLKTEAGEIYEKLILLDFADKHFDGLQPTIGKEKFKQTLADKFQVERDHEHYPDGTEYNPEAISEPNTEKIKDIVSQMPPETEEVDGLMQKDKTKEEENKQNKDEMPGVSYDDLPDFEPAQEKAEPEEKKEHPEQSETEGLCRESSSKEKESAITESKKKSSRNEVRPSEPRKKSLNSKLVKDLKLGLNNRIAFTKHLFNGDKNALQESLKDINNCKDLREAKQYLEQDVKPKYDNWKGKEEYEERFLGLIENKFSE